MIRDTGDVSAISIDVARRFLDALDDFRARLPREVASECSALEEALAEERVCVDALADAPVLLITGDEPSVARIFFAEILGPERVPTRGGAFLIGTDHPRSRESQRTSAAVEYLTVPGHRLFQRQVLYVPDFQRLGRETPAAAKAMSNWSCVAVAIASETPDWLERYDRPSFLLRLSSVAGRVTLCRRGLETINDVDSAELWQRLEDAIDRDAWPRRVLKMFQRLAAPIGEARDAMALYRLRLGKAENTLQNVRDRMAEVLHRCGDRIVTGASDTLLSIASHVWSALPASVEQHISVEERVRYTPDFKKSTVRKVIEYFTGDIPERESVERVSYQVSDACVEEFKEAVKAHLPTSVLSADEITEECLRTERELESSTLALVKLNDDEITEARASTVQLLQQLLERCNKAVADSAQERVSQVPSRPRSFSAAGIESGLVGVLKERLSDHPIRNPMDAFEALDSSAQSGGETTLRELFDDIVAVWSVKRERVVRLEGEARELVDWAGTLEVSAQEDLRSVVSKVRRAVRVSLERGGQGDGIASSFARSIAGIFDNDRE